MAKRLMPPVHLVMTAFKKAPPDTLCLIVLLMALLSRGGDGFI
jgi:hypothetical protein